MKHTMAARLATTILSHPQTPRLVELAAREAVAAAAERLERHARRDVVQAVIEREDQQAQA